MKDKMNDMEVKNETIVEKDQIKQEKLNIDKKISHENQQKTTENIFANKEKKETLDDLIIRKSMKKRKKPTTTVNLSKTVKKKKSFLNFQLGNESSSEINIPTDEKFKSLEKENLIEETEVKKTKMKTLGGQNIFGNFDPSKVQLKKTK